MNTREVFRSVGQDRQNELCSALGLALSFFGYYLAEARDSNRDFAHVLVAMKAEGGIAMLARDAVELSKMQEMMPPLSSDAGTLDSEQEDSALAFVVERFMTGIVDYFKVKEMSVEDILDSLLKEETIGKIVSEVKNAITASTALFRPGEAPKHSLG